SEDFTQYCYLFSLTDFLSETPHYSYEGFSRGACSEIFIRKSSDAAWCTLRGGRACVTEVLRGQSLPYRITMKESIQRNVKVSRGLKTPNQPRVEGNDASNYADI